MARLILATAEGQQAIELRPINSLGRHPNNTIQLLDKIVPKEHCILELRDGHFVLRDLGSLNGTYVNGERVPRNAIHSFACSYNGKEVFRATLSTGIAANPMLRFFFVAAESGEVRFWWLDDDEVEGTANARLVVA